MMRLKSITAISMIVVAVSLAYLGLCPPARDRVQSAARAMDFPADLRAQARARPDDPQVWLALAAASVHGPGPAGGLEPFKRLFKLRPRWAAPYLVLGAAMARRVPLTRPKELAVLRLPVHEKSRRLTAHERDALRRAQEALRKAMVLDPDDAAPDYLLAYLALAERRDQDAYALLASGLRKPDWSIGEREVSIAAYRVAAREMPALEAGMEASAAWDWLIGEPVRQVARVTMGMARLARQRGDDERAIRLSSSVMHLGEIMMAGGYTLIEVLVGKAVWAIGYSQLLTREERTAAIGLLRQPKRGESAAKYRQWTQARGRLIRARVAAYLREHGHDNLAKRLLALGDETERWSRDLRPKFEPHMDRTSNLFMLTAVLRQALIGASGSSGLLIVCGLAYLILVSLHRRPVPITWARWKWALLVLSCAGIAFLVSLGTNRWRVWASDDGSLACWGGTLATIGLPLLLLAGLAVIWRVRRRVPREQRPGFGRQYVGTLMALLLPVTALALLGCAAVSVPTIKVAKRMTREHKVAIYQGELASLGLKPPVIR